MSWVQVLSYRKDCWASTEDIIHHSQIRDAHRIEWEWICADFAASSLLIFHRMICLIIANSTSTNANEILFLLVLSIYFHSWKCEKI